jgi:hypothetical protein
MKSLIFLFTFLFAALCISCSSSVEETREEIKEENPEEEYHFDEVPLEEMESEQVLFFIQIGAFTTKDNAEKFAEISSEELDREVFVSYNQNVNLFVVRLKENFKDKREAEKVRDQIKLNENYKDAWVTSDLK